MPNTTKGSGKTIEHGKQNNHHHPEQDYLEVLSDLVESSISEVLAGKRKLNRTQIAKLGRYFGVEPGAFLS